MTIVQGLRAASLALAAVLMVGANAGLAASLRQDMGAPTSAEEPTTLPRCSALSNSSPSAGNAAAGSGADAGVQEAPSAGLSAEQQAVAARGASTAGLDGPGATLDPRGGTIPVDCADTAAGD